jgi:antitoxin component YwqK of YwqJK toxin-antitoxin module
MPDVNIAEIPYESGEIHFRYSRYLSSDGSRWIRHGLFRAYYQSGSLASEGNYADGVEQGPWRDYHENGKLASEGMYERGQEVGEWKYWQADGSVFRAALDHR